MQAPRTEADEPLSDPGVLMKYEKFIRRLKAIAGLILILVKIWIALVPVNDDEEVCPRRSPPATEHLFAMEAQVSTLAGS